MSTAVLGAECAKLRLEDEDDDCEKTRTVEERYTKDGALIAQRKEPRLAQTSDTLLPDLSAEQAEHAKVHTFDCREMQKEFEEIRVMVTTITLGIEQSTKDLLALSKSGSLEPATEVEAPVRKELSAEERMEEEDAVRCQLAYSVQNECKFLFLRAMRRRSKEKFLEYGRPNMPLVKYTDMSEFEELLRRESPRKYQEIAKKIFPKNKDIFFNTLLHLEARSEPSRLLDGMPVTLEVAKRLIDTMNLCTSFPRDVWKPPRNDDLGAVRSEAHRMLALLNELRKDEEFLFIHYY